MITYGGGLARVRDADPGMVVRTAFRLIRAKRLPDSLRGVQDIREGLKCVEVIASVHSDGDLRTIAKLLREAPERSSFLVKDAPDRRSGGLSTTRVQR